MLIIYFWQTCMHYYINVKMKKEKFWQIAYDDMELYPTKWKWINLCIKYTIVYIYTSGSLISHPESRSCAFLKISNSEPSGVCILKQNNKYLRKTIINVFKTLIVGFVLVNVWGHSSRILSACLGDRLSPVGAHSKKKWMWFSRFSIKKWKELLGSVGMKVLLLSC